MIHGIPEDTIEVSGHTDESFVDGSGVRYTLFTQGCLHNCLGCHNPDTHEFGKGKLVSVQEIFDDIVRNPLIDGVTYSGGDPMEQVDSLVKLSKMLHEAGLNIWCYTGYTYEQCISDENRVKLLDSIDVLVDGRYDMHCRTLSIPFIGSANQRIIDVKATRDRADGEIILVSNGE